MYLIFFIFCISVVYGDPLPSWNEGTAKQAILNFVQKTTDSNSPYFVPLDERIAVFDQDGTLWVEQPMYIQVLYCLDQLSHLAPELKEKEPFKTALTGNIRALSGSDLEKIAAVTLSGMSVEQFRENVEKWLLTKKDPRFNRLYTDLTYLPMEEVLQYFRANGFKTYIVTGGGQDFVRVFAEKVYGIPPEQVVGSAGEVKYTYDSKGAPELIKEAKLLLNDNYAGKPEGIHLMIGRQPFAAFGNSTGDREMLEYTKAGKGLRLALLVLHNDPIREYAYGPAEGLPDSKVGTFTQGLFDETKEKDWIIIRMKEDWKQVFKSQNRTE